MSEVHYIRGRILQLGTKCQTTFHPSIVSRSVGRREGKLRRRVCASIPMILPCPLGLVGTRSLRTRQSIASAKPRPASPGPVMLSAPLQHKAKGRRLMTQLKRETNDRLPAVLLHVQCST